MARKVHRDQVSLLTLLEEATHLIRRIPVSAWLIYLAGTGPFIIYLFFFWSDMTRSALASSRLLESSLILAAFYVGMKVAQSLFSDRLMAILEGRSEDRSPLTLRGRLRLIASQALIHSTMPWILVLSGIAVLPIAWAYSFYHNVTILSVDHFRRGGKTRDLIREALSQAHYRPLQTHGVLVSTFIIAILVYVNLLAGFATVVFLAKVLTGTENAFSMNGWLFISSSFQTLLFTLCYLVMNPLMKALFTLRCFYGRSRVSGADILARIRFLNRTQPINPTLIAAILATVWGFCLATSSQAQSNATLPPDTSRPIASTSSGGNASSQDLQRSISDVLQGSEYQWRMPREVTAAEQESWLGLMIKEVGHSIKRLFDSMGEQLAKLRDWFFGPMDINFDDSTFGEKKESTWLEMLPELLLALSILLILAVGWFAYRHWKQRKITKEVAPAPTAAAEIDLEREDVLATQLPEQQWMQLAREKMQSGELRLALRALFLATLANLGERRLLTITRSKSNGDYIREIERRARSQAGLSQSFTEQAYVFDRVWYGWHEVTPDLLSSVQQQHERITQHAS